MANTLHYREPVLILPVLGNGGFYWVRLALDGASTNGAFTGFPSNLGMRTIRASYGGFKETDIPVAGVATSTGFTGVGSANGTNGKFVDILVYGEGR